MLGNHAVHFVGFRADREYWSAVRAFGPPDFIHYVHDLRMYSLVADGDLIVLGSRGRDEISQYNGSDILENLNEQGERE